MKADYKTQHSVPAERHVSVVTDCF